MVSVIALSVALGGGAYAAVKLKPDSVGSRQVKDDSLGGADVNEAKLGQVPTADRAGDAALLDGVDSAALARRGLAWQAVDDAHQSSSPPGRFRCHHSDGVVCDEYFSSLDGPGGHAGAAFARDDFGIVHLQGSIVWNSVTPGAVNPGALFDLPVGFRPAERVVFAALENGTEINRLDIEASGSLKLEQAYEPFDWFSLDGISFPCGPSGANGCP